MLKNIQYFAIQGTEIIRTFAAEINSICDYCPTSGK